MKYLFLVLCFGFSSWLYAKPSDKITALTPKAKRDFDTSQIGQIYANNAIYTIHLSKIKAQKTAPKSYKIFYILDGNGHLPIALNALSKAGFLYEGLESVLIVSIGYGGEYEGVAFPALRKRDYTPKYKLDCDDGGDFWGSSFVGTDFSDDDSVGGGADKFLQTLQNDIIPFTRSFVQERLGAELQAKSGIFGHSFGGLFVLYALSNSSGNFSHFYAVSPSLWWGGGKFIDIDFGNIKVDYATLWIMQDEINQVSKVSEASKASKASKASEAKIRTAKINSKELAHLIESQSNIKPIYKAFYGHTHGSVVAPAFFARHK